MTRILVTGSRHWTDAETIHTALWQAWIRLGCDPRSVLVHGACHLGGADIIARDVWASCGFTDEPHPAERDDRGRLLGPKRNQHMVDLGADICLAFPLPDSRGTYDCMRRAVTSGITVVDYGPVQRDSRGLQGALTPPTHPPRPRGPVMSDHPTIWKFTLDVEDATQAFMPEGAVVLPHVHPESPGVLNIWAEVDPGEPQELRGFRVVGTGNPVGEVGAYIGTAIAPPFVWHLYEAPAGTP